jgi:hypothetical protein
VYTADKELDSSPATKSAEVTHKYTMNNRRKVSCDVFWMQVPALSFFSHPVLISLYYTKEWKKCTPIIKNVAKYNIISTCLFCVLYIDMKALRILPTKCKN